ncbi:class I SAM-dependent methyltransferase [Permianibacter sp. IMCC34836]|uniref:class I SAM-dependent methyltransferase n=1 Tax=Permianibacter fluminis TaxID=2738515 RepID=UPI00155194A3|nr:class I SAM-dependent methyltransferase [Permianibacter fluminis]NQD35829.1 class I SAM-dependent methyltransferase [Permianibacter fluminis]
MPSPLFAVHAQSLDFQAAAAALAEQLQLPLGSADFTLELADTLCLRAQIDGETVRLQPDFVNGVLDWRRKHGGGRGEPVVRAVWGKNANAPTVFDGTGGLARDSFVLAAAGCTVIAREQHPIIAALVSHALSHASHCAARDQNEALRATLARLDYQHGDTARWLATAAPGSVDVIYLDPMFPPRPGRAKVKKDMQILQRLTEAGLGDELLAPARRVARQRVVVKRPDYAPPLAGVAPSGALPAGANRFDIYPPAP